jgi:hypothetical protein
VKQNAPAACSAAVPRLYQIFIDDLVKSLKRRISVIPAKAGIQLSQIPKKILWTPVSTGVTTFYENIFIRNCLAL